MNADDTDIALTIFDGADEYVSLKIHDLDLAASIVEITEINRCGDIFPVPGAAYSLRGVINLRGDVVTVIDLGLLLTGRPVEVDERSRFVVVECEGERVALLVEEIADIVAFSAAEIEGQPANVGGADRRWFKGVVKRRDGLVLVLDTAEVVALTDGGDS